MISAMTIVTPGSRVLLTSPRTSSRSASYVGRAPLPAVGEAQHDDGVLHLFPPCPPAALRPVDRDTEQERAGRPEVSVSPASR
jgi:hypothetical protein